MQGAPTTEGIFKGQVIPAACDLARNASFMAAIAWQAWSVLFVATALWALTAWLILRVSGANAMAASALQVSSPL